MPLNAEVLAADTVARLNAQYGSDASKITTDVGKVAEAMAEAVIEHLKVHGVINVAVTGTCPTGAVAGTGVGTIS